MGEALIRGMLQSGFLANASDAVAFDPYPPQREKLKTQLGITVVTSNIDVVKQVQWVILCVKPNTVGAVFKEIAPVLTPDHLIISICAGVTIQTLSAGAGTNRVVRVMPNTPCMVGQSASGFACAEGVTEPEKATILRMLQSVGVAVEVAENLLDAVTGVSGSGPGMRQLRRGHWQESTDGGGVVALDSWSECIRCHHLSTYPPLDDMVCIVCIHKHARTHAHVYVRAFVPVFFSSCVCVLVCVCVCVCARARAYVCSVRGVVH
eukprot:NODE_3635_length_1186_cov_28.547507_g3452_i0.p1 GENE.NODE_3635_length_1186_cov_28.547507_g3452_i0~~NODE_3635_length_1186_cov_28.547507_g3452_i0.p1  ORF type:complete len:280 (+),score=44.86 NODE_3635_length_1186_cov_28.547507_g3452_i0:51-842(+)